MGPCHSQSKARKDYDKTVDSPDLIKPEKPSKLEQIQKGALKLVTDLTGIRVQKAQPRMQRQDRDLVKDDQLFQHPNNPHREFFQTTSTPNGTKIVFNSLSDTCCYNCIKKQAIPPNKTTIFKIKQTKTSKQHVYIGITTQTILNSPKNWRETIAFASNSGSIWENGSWHAKGDKVKDEEIINVQVDTSKRLITWKFDDSRQWTSSIPQKMRDKYLFLVIMMHDKGDTIEILK